MACSLEQTIVEKGDLLGLSKEMIAEKMGLSLEALAKKVQQKIPFTFEELRILSDYLSFPMIELCLQAGVLKDEDLAEYQRVFAKTEMLSESEKEHIQGFIDMLAGNR